MAVTVEYQGAAGIKERTHDDGEMYLVRDGNLFIQSRADSSANYTVAVYGPGKWNNARTEAKAKS